MGWDDAKDQEPNWGGWGGTGGSGGYGNPNDSGNADSGNEPDWGSYGGQGGIGGFGSPDVQDQSNYAPAPDYSQDDQSNYQPGKYYDTPKKDYRGFFSALFGFLGGLFAGPLGAIAGKGIGQYTGKWGGVNAGAVPDSYYDRNFGVGSPGGSVGAGGTGGPDDRGNRDGYLGSINAMAQNFQPATEQNPQPVQQSTYNMPGIGMPYRWFTSSFGS